MCPSWAPSPDEQPVRASPVDAGARKGRASALAHNSFLGHGIPRDGPVTGCVVDIANGNIYFRKTWKFTGVAYENAQHAITQTGGLSELQPSNVIGQDNYLREYRWSDVTGTQFMSNDEATEEDRTENLYEQMEMIADAYCTHFIFFEEATFEECFADLFEHPENIADADFTSPVKNDLGCDAFVHLEVTIAKHERTSYRQSVYSNGAYITKCLSVGIHYTMDHTFGTTRISS